MAIGECDNGVNYYPHHIGDYAKDTRHLSMIEDGAYRRLIDVYYSHELPLPKDEAAVCRLVCARGRDEKAAVGTILREFFKLTPEGWTHKRCNEEIAKAQCKARKASESAGMRWHSERNANASAAGMRTHSEGNAPNSQEPIAKSQKPVTNSVTPKRSNGAKPDPAKQEIWTTGRALLVGQGVEKDEAGAFLGKLVKDYGEKKVLEVIRIANVDPKADLKSWLPAACQERSGKQGALESKNASVVAEALKDVTH